MKKALLQDIRRYDNQNLKVAIIKAILAPGFHAVLVYRFGKMLREKLDWPVLRVIIRLFTWTIQLPIKFLWGIEIPYSAKISPGFLICHFSGVFIGSRVIIGNNCTIHQCVTIGKGGGLGPTQGEPVLGDGVFVGANSIILGSIKVGDRVTIGAMCYVNSDVEAYSLVKASCSPSFRKKL